jgi:transketolase
VPLDSPGDFAGSRPPCSTAADVRSLALAIRIGVLRTIGAAGIGHIGGDYSVADILAVIYGSVLNVDPANPAWPQRDRFVMSKGHAAASLYTALALRGFFPEEELTTFAGPDSRLGGHPNRLKTPGIETNTGPLGHGLPVAAGMAKGAVLTGSDWRTYVVVGDGELQEGSNWEAIMFAAHHRLTNLTLIVDRNRLQQGAGTEETNALDPLDAKLAAFGWWTHVVDGHDVDALMALLSGPRDPDRPLAIVAETVKGKGVSFMEGLAAWHHKVPVGEHYEQAMAELLAVQA